MNRRDFIKVSGALGVCLVTPRIASSSALIEDGAVIDEAPHMVQFEVHDLLPGTNIWIGTVDDQGIGQKTLWKGESTDDIVLAELPLEYEGQDVVMRTINLDCALYNQRQFSPRDCAKKRVVNVFQEVDRSYHA